MSDARAIGVFDSGIGGLTVLHEIHRALPDESTIYLGDVARCPYGPRRQDEVRGFAHEIARFLVAHHDVKLIVVACNTASAAALESLQAAYRDMPIIGVVAPGAHAAVGVSRRQRIGVFATPGTVASGAYTRAVHAIAPAAHVAAVACPALVPLVESGETQGPHAEALLRTYLGPLEAAGIDTLILGCTHYPLLRPALDRVVDGRLAVVDSAGTTAAEVAALLDSRGLRAPIGQGSRPRRRLYTTGAPESFRRVAARLFGAPVPPIEQVRLASHPDDLAAVSGL